MKKVVVLLIVMLFMVAVSGLAEAANDAQEIELLTLINEYRIVHGLNTLKFSDTLSRAAEDHSLDMAANNYFNHYSLDGRTPWERISAAGYTYNTALGENLAAGFPTPVQALEAWKNSPGHNDVLLNADYSVVGMGYAYYPNSHYLWYWTADFGGYDDTIPPGQLEVTNIGPTHCYYGTATDVFIEGRGFTAETQVTIGSIVFVEPLLLSSMRMKVTLPSDAAIGKWSLKVHNPDGSEINIPGAFEVLDQRSRYDIDSNRMIDIFDLVIIGRAFGSETGSPGWDTRADLDGSGVIDILDLVPVGKNFGFDY